MLIRYLSAGSAACGATFGLLFLMQLLIVIQDEGISAPAIHMPEILKVREEQDIKPKEPKPDVIPPPDVITPPKPPVTTDPIESTVLVTLPKYETTSPTIGRFGNAFGDGEMMPIARVQPVYPGRALSRGLEGWVVCEHTVTTSGSVSDARASSSSSKIFERSAIAACEKFRYKPRVVNGEAVAVEGVETRLTFRIASD